MAANRSLVIVESPAKARTIAGFLGKDYVVESSIGHIRDLVSGAKEMPPALKKEPWAYLGVDVEHGFKPYYVVDADKKQHIQKLKNLLADAKELYLATDEDREGESIAWHLLEVLKPRIPVKRMVFHEITKPAIKKAIESPREIDRGLVEAQEARRILDRLYGYDVSPVLWKKVNRGLSAGRVQSVATRIVVDRERQRMAFKKATYWDLEATLSAPSGGTFTAGLVAVGGKRIATSKDFDDEGKLTREALLLDEARATLLAAGLDGQTLTVTDVERKPNKRSPAAPFMTSTLQQEASRKLRYAAQRTMRAAQRLYEGGFITYMRTDSTQLSESAIESARAQIARMYGQEYLPKEPRIYAKKVKNAQEAHEAIRPAGDVFRLPEEVAREVGPDEGKLYELIWMRTIASQMVDSLGESVQVKIAGRAKTGDEVELSASGHTITFPGFLRAYVEGSDDPTAELESRERPLPKLNENDALPVGTVEPRGHETQPPARFTEASLVQKLEELGVGRPSTYASILGTITDRGYVWKKGTALVPSFLAFAVVRLLEQHFDALVDYAFTAKMEDDLDQIAGGHAESGPWLERFYFGQSGPKTIKKAKGAAKKAPGERATGGIDALGLKTLVDDRLDEIDARAINTLDLGKDAEGRDVQIRVGKYGPYLQRGEDKASIPEGLPPDELTIEKATELLAAPSAALPIGNDPATGLPVYVKNGRFGSYVQLGDPTESGDKPKTASLLRSMSPDKVTLDDALRLLSLPRVVGQDADGKDIVAQIGRYGAYITRGADTRSLGREEEVFTLTTEQALALLAQPKTRGNRAPAEPLKVLGEDAVSKKPMRVMQGRFGLYVTDGETNASLRKDDALETLTDQRASELLQERRDRVASGAPVKGRRGGAKRGGAKAPSGKKAAATNGEPAAKKPAKKAAASTDGAESKSAAKPAKGAAKKGAAKKPAKKGAAKKGAKPSGGAEP
ncbi:MAG TPA: type I DNA topoisomerase [Polyangiaceae bacterium]|nr:type I DNA topoisomerase [Polyangiaceae bacterium]